MITVRLAYTYGRSDAQFMSILSGLFLVVLFLAWGSVALAQGPVVSSIDRHSPTIEYTENDTITWRYTFNEDVQNVDPADFELRGSTATLSVSAVGADTYDIMASGGDLASVDGNVSIGIVPENNIQDTDGNVLARLYLNSGSTNNYWFILANTLPVASLQAAPAAVSTTDPVDIVVRYNTPIWFADLGDLGGTNAAIGSPSGADGSSDRSVTITPNGNGDITISAAAFGVCNNPTSGFGCGNAHTVGTINYLPGTAPTITSIARHLPNGSPALNGGGITWRVVFNKPVRNVDATDFTVTGTTGTLSIEAVNAWTYDLTVQGGNMPFLAGTITLGFAGGQNIEDLASNALTSLSPTGTDETSIILLNAGGPVSENFQINTTTAHHQDEPSIAQLSDGGYIVTYASWSRNNNIQDFDIRARRYQEDGTPAADDFLVNSTIGGDQNEPRVAALQDGGFVIAWHERRSTNASSNVRLQRFSRMGARVGPEILIDSATGRRQRDPDILGLPDGGFVVVFDDESQTGTDNSQRAIRAQRFDAGGIPAGSIFQVNTTIANRQSEPSIAVLANGDFIIAWSDESNTGFDTDTSSIRAQRYNSSWVAQGGEIDVNSTISGAQTAPVVAALPDGTFVIAYVSNSASGGDDIRARHFQADGTPIGPDFEVNLPSSDDQNQPAIAPLASGGFFISWTHSVDDNGNINREVHGAPYAINAQRFALPFRVNDEENGEQKQSSVLGAANGEVVVMWADGSQSLTDADETAIFAQVFGEDSDAPRVAFITRQSPQSEVITTTSATWRVSFTESVVNLSVDDFTITGTTASLSLSSASGDSVDVTISGGDFGTLEGTVILGFSQSQDIADTAGNRLTNTTPEGANDNTFTRQNPGLSSINLGPNLRSPTNSDTLQWRVRFTGDVTDHDAADWQVSGTTATVDSVALTENNTADEWYVNVSGGDLANLNGTVSIALAATQNIQLGGSPIIQTVPSGDNESFILDNQGGQTTSIVRFNPVSEFTNADTLVFRFTFPESIRGPDNTDPFSITGTTAQASFVISSGDPQNAPQDPFEVDVTLSGGDLANVDGEVGVTLDTALEWTDAVGNPFNPTPPGPVETYQVDNTNPTVVISSAAIDGVTDPFTISIDFSEIVTGFTIDDLAVVNATASDLTSDGALASPLSTAGYTATITPSGSSGDVITVDLVGASAIDRAGNPNAAAAQFRVTQGAPPVSLMVSTVGVGEGTVTSIPAGIDCGADCQSDFPFGTTVTLAASPSLGSSFASWTEGPCAESVRQECTFDLLENRSAAARFTLDEPPQGRVFAATLPAARSGHIGGPPITAFLSIVSEAGTPAQSCRVTAANDAPFTLSYQRVDGSNNPVGPPDPLFDIESGGILSFVLVMTPTLQTGDGGYLFLPEIECQASDFDAIDGVSSIFITIGATPGPDILSISATPSNDGVIRIPGSGRVGLMTAAALNIGAGDGSSGAGEVTLTTTVDTGEVAVPISVEICQINIASACISPRGSQVVTSNLPQNVPAFFAAFIRDESAGSGITLDPANNRLFLRFADASGIIRSVTSAAVTAPSAQNVFLDSALPVGRWSVLARSSHGYPHPPLERHTVHVSEAGIGIHDDGNEPRLVRLRPGRETVGTNAIRARFFADQREGLYSVDGFIRVGGALAPIAGDYWGVRDRRGMQFIDWSRYEGRYGDVFVTEANEIRGNFQGCAVFGDALLRIIVELTLSGCDLAGTFYATLDVPVNDNDTTGAALLIVNESAGWRLEW